MESCAESRNNIKRRLQKEQRELNIRKFFNNKLAVVGGLITLIMVFLAVFAPFISPKDLRYGCCRSSQTPLQMDIFLVLIHLAEMYYPRLRRQEFQMTIGASVGFIQW